MALSLFFAAQPSSRVKSSAARTLPETPPLSVTANPNAAPVPSSTCALRFILTLNSSLIPHKMFHLTRSIECGFAGARAARTSGTSADQSYWRKLPISLKILACRISPLIVVDWSRAKLAVRGSSDNPLIGLYEEGTHNVIDIPSCRAHHPSINAAVELLKRGIAKLDVEPHDEDNRPGELRYVQMAVTLYNTSLLPLSERYHNGRVQITLVWNSRNENSPSSDKLNALAHFLRRSGGPCSGIYLVHSVWANFQTSTSDVRIAYLVLKKKVVPSAQGFRHKQGLGKVLMWRHLLGERDFWEHVGGINVSLDPSSFGQANTRAFDSLLQKLQKYVPYGTSVADLYTGAGIIGLSLAVARKCRSVKCAEINKEAKLSFEKTISRLLE